MKPRLEELEKSTHSPDFWNDRAKAAAVLKELSRLKERVEMDSRYGDAEEEVRLFKKMFDEGEAETGEVSAYLSGLEEELERDETAMVLSGETDDNNAIVAVHPGAGGTESQDWAMMLTRMYTRWSESKGYRVRVLDLQDGEEAGIKSATFTVEGEKAYGYLKAEKGVHRLVRISPYDANRRRHTSFASVAVFPEIDEAIEVKIEEKDLRIDTYRAGGHGGQHVNVTDSAVRITHIPTGIIAQCQNERSQHRNREMAMKVLKSRLYELEREKKREEKEKSLGEKKEIAWGSQIRSYVLHPYQMIKDHRTGVETSQTTKVLDGDLDDFILAYLMSGKLNKI